MTACAFLTIPLAPGASPLIAQDALTLDQARAAMIARAPSNISNAIATWEGLTRQGNLRFTDYADFVLAYPGFPRQDLLRRRAEKALDSEERSPREIAAFFGQFPPLTNSGKGRYARALTELGQASASEIARAAWRGGVMAEADELAIAARFGALMRPEDQIARMNALIWQEQAEAAARQLSRLPQEVQEAFARRLAVIRRQTLWDMASVDRQNPTDVFIWARAFRKSGQTGQAAALFADKLRFSAPVLDAQDMIAEMLRLAGLGSAQDAVRIAQNYDAVFTRGTDISRLSFALRDDYTTLMWKGGTNALWRTGEPHIAAELFYQYGAAARSPQTRSKGFFWAGHAAAIAGDNASANRYFEMASVYAERFYGQLALRRLGQMVPSLGGHSDVRPLAAEKAAFEGRPLVKAVRELARGAPWRLGIYFYREIADQASGEADYTLVADLAAETNRRDLAVILSDAAGADGHNQFVAQGFPLLTLPPNADWTMAHAITRQESQFAQNALSHAGARGLMQLMPGTAREQANLLGLGYDAQALIDDAGYNIALGDAYFRRMLRYYNGSYPLAVAAYNAGAGNVNAWLRANGDPRTGAVDWITWIERIPFYETKNYVQRVLENAAVYEHLYPDRSADGKPRRVDDFLK